MRMVAAILFLVIAAALGILEVLAVVDPVGTKMADDGDPFGNPYVPWTQHAGSVAAIIACVAAAALLLRPRKKN